MKTYYALQSKTDPEQFFRPNCARWGAGPALWATIKGPRLHLGKGKNENENYRLVKVTVEVLNGNQDNG